MCELLLLVCAFNYNVFVGHGNRTQKSKFDIPFMYVPYVEVANSEKNINY